MDLILQEHKYVNLFQGKDHFVSMVRNINTKGVKPIDSLRKHLSNSKILHKYIIVKETSLLFQQLHLHAIIILDNAEDAIKIMAYIDEHHSKTNIDKCRIIDNKEQAKYYFKYMLKDFKYDHTRYVNYDSNHENALYCMIKHVSNIRVEDDDPFIDESETIKQITNFGKKAK